MVRKRITPRYRLSLAAGRLTVDVEMTEDKVDHALLSAAGGAQMRAETMELTEADLEALESLCAASRVSIADVRAQRADADAVDAEARARLLGGQP